MLLSREEAKKVIDKVLSFSQADDVGVTVGGRDLAQTRFSNNSITTSGSHLSSAVNISVTRNAKSGSVSLNETSDDALRAAVARAAELAEFSPPDPEYMPPLGPQKYPEIDGYDPATAKAGVKDLLPGVRAAVEGAAAKDLNGAGFYQRSVSHMAFGNSKGNFGFATRTSADYSMTVRTPDGTGSGWSSGEGRRLSDFDATKLARVAIDKAILSQKPRTLEPGKYTVVLEAAAVSDIMGSLGGGTFSARSAEEGRSYFTKKGGGTLVGEKVFSEKVTMRSDPFDPRNPGMPWAGGVSTRAGSVGGAFFAGGGGGGGSLGSYLPTGKMTWIEKGVVKQLAYNRYWAAKRNVEPTPPMSNLIIEGEENSVEDLIKATDRGLLVTRFWYIRTVNPQTVQVTGLTRDGVFMIEKGKIAYPVNNFRWNESPANMLINVEMLARPERVGGDLMPAMKVKDFNFTSISEAV